MINPEPKIIQALAITVRQYPEILQWVEGWKQRELDTLPHAVNNPALAQGRCQVLQEISNLLKQAPEIAAKR